MASPQPSPVRTTPDPGGPAHVDVGRPRLDAPNELILGALATHGRATMRDLAEVAGLSESSVRDRVATLELQGVVTGYGARIDWAQVGLPMQALVEADCAPGRALEVARLVQAIPGVVQAMVTTGSPNFVAVLRARDLWDVRSQMVQVRQAPLERVRVRITLEEIVAARSPRPAFRSGSPRVTPVPAPAPSRAQALPVRPASPPAFARTRPWMHAPGQPAVAAAT